MEEECKMAEECKMEEECKIYGGRVQDEGRV